MKIQTYKETFRLKTQSETHSASKDRQRHIMLEKTDRDTFHLKRQTDKDTLRLKRQTGAHSAGKDRHIPFEKTDRHIPLEKTDRHRHIPLEKTDRRTKTHSA